MQLIIDDSHRSGGRSCILAGSVINGRNNRFMLICHVVKGKHWSCAGQQTIGGVTSSRPSVYDCHYKSTYSKLISHLNSTNWAEIVVFLAGLWFSILDLEIRAFLALRDRKQCICLR